MGSPPKDAFARRRPDRVALINQTLARPIWPGERARGQRFRSAAAPSAPWTTIIAWLGRGLDSHRDGL
jgi:hypothetical protein